MNCATGNKHCEQPTAGCGYIGRVLSAKFEFVRQVTHASIDLIEKLLPPACNTSPACPTDSHSLSCYSPHESSCDVPEPCWMPKLIGELDCEICESGRAVLTLWITNEDHQAQTYELSSQGDAKAGVSFAPATLTLAAKQRGKVVVTFDAPPQTASCRQSCYDLLIWVASCRKFYLRWRVTTSACPKPCCLEVAFEDVPDYQLHWYDHFYACKPCAECHPQ